MKQMTGVDPEVIRARQKLIRDDAPCVGCGARQADCEAARGQDPTAPPWFGCCARGTMLGPCSHQSDPGALTALVKEIEAGEVRPAEEILAERAERAARRAARRASRTTPDGKLLDTAGAMFGQGEWWLQKSGTWIRITDIPFVHGRDDFRLLSMMPALKDVGMLLRSVERQHAISFRREHALIRTNVPSAEFGLQVWVRNL